MDLEQALTIIHSLSYTSKMPCFSFSISANNCKRGKKLRNVPNSVCSKCYALRGNFARPTIQKGLQARQTAMKNPLWSEAMAIVLTYREHSGHFRWFSSGDLQGVLNLIKICDVARRTPHIKHWLSTREIGIIREFKRAGFLFPSNLIVRVAADLIEQKPNPTLLKELGVLGSSVSKTHFNCPASYQENQCVTCRKCWDKNVKTITYKYH